MAKLSLLDIVNDIANDLDTEPVNSITDTVESVQIAQIVKTTYFELIANRNWPHLQRTVQLDSVVDATRPTYLKLPELTKELVSLTYNKATESDPTRNRFQRIPYYEPEDFLEATNNRNVTNDDVDLITDFGGAPVYIYNNRQPERYTSFDDEYIVFDSYNSALEDTLQNSNTSALIYFEPSWTHDDGGIPDLPSEAFPLLIEEAKSTAFVVLKQQPNSKAEQKARRQNSWLSRKAWRTNGGVRYPNYGRKPNGN